MHAHNRIIIVARDLEGELVGEHAEEHDADGEEVVGFALGAVGVAGAGFGGHIDDGAAVAVGDSVNQFVWRGWGGVGGREAWGLS